MKESKPAYFIVDVFGSSKYTGNQLAVLILGSAKHQELKEILFDLGFIPIERRDMIQALEMLHHERFVAVFIDYDHVDIDALEFILNVRDMKLSLPVMLIMQRMRQKKPLILILLK